MENSATFRDFQNARGFLGLLRCFAKSDPKTGAGKFHLWLQEPFNPSLQFKELLKDVWSVRINQNFRALGRRKGNLIVWFWIGTHAEYDQLLRRLN